MEKHTVIVEVLENQMRGKCCWNNEHIATYYREYPNEAAAVNNAKEIASSKVCSRYKDGNGDVCTRFFLAVCVEDSNENAFAYNNKCGIDFDNIKPFFALTASEAVNMLKSRGFKPCF